MKVACSELKPYPGNPRTGNVDVIAESLDQLGQYRPIVIDQHSTVLAGNHTLKAAQRLGWTEIECHRVEVDAETARKINLVDNRSNDLATYDDDLLLALIESCDDLSGTGYTDDDLAKLISPPEPDPTPAMDADLEWRVVVECRDEAHQADLLERFDQEGLVCRPLMS